MLPLVGWPPRCLLRATTGVPCPFCGMTTGVLETLRGDLGAAFAANPAAPLAVVATVVLVAAIALRRFGARTGVAAAWSRAIRWRWPVLAGLWAFELHRFALL